MSDDYTYKELRILLPGIKEHRLQTVLNRHSKGVGSGAVNLYTKRQMELLKEYFKAMDQWYKKKDYFDKNFLQVEE